MINNKEFMKGFLQYLQSYYGSASGFSLMNDIAPMYPNQPRLNLFQEASMQMEPPMMEVMQDLGSELQQPMGSINQQPALPGETLGQELNGLFPGPNDPMRMN
jgi:hypothetical protein